MVLISVLLAASLVEWSGTAQVDVMIWEPGGEHPYTTDFTLDYAEEPRAHVPNAKGASPARDRSLVPRRVAIDVRHEVRHADGRPICNGGGRELVKTAPNGAIVTRQGDPTLYQLVLPRAVGAFACGSKVNARDRWIVIGSGLFDVVGDVDAADAEARALESDGSVMRGEYRFSDADRGRAVRHDYHVRWDLRRRLSP